MFSKVRPHQWVAIRLPSDTIKVEQMVPNTNINLGKFGSFRTNQVIDRPFWVTWEILEKSEDRAVQELRLVKASELHADALLDEAESDILGDATASAELDDYGLPTDGKSNVNIFDDPSNQKLTAQEIESLKSDGMSNPRDLIAKIMASHSSLDQKTAFSLAKYTIRKQKKYMKRFTILPMDVAMMTDWMMSEREFSKVLEIRNEVLSLICSWANVHAAGNSEDDGSTHSRNRYLVVDDTGGLIVAAVAEKMGLLHHNPSTARPEMTEPADVDSESREKPTDHQNDRRNQNQSPKSNTIHLIHSNPQPNLSLLRYFNFDPNITPAFSDPTPAHPLHKHLKAISWLQLIEPESDSTYQEPTTKTQEELSAMKSNARSTYYRKRRRWERCKALVEETQAGGFNGLIIASYTNPLSILHHLIPLLTGGAQVVIYNPNVEPLSEVFDAYSTARRTAFLNLEEHEREAQIGSVKFPVDPTLTLGFMLQTVRARKWQVLPGRTHPLMTARGGAECYIAVATRVLPYKGKIQARGKQTRRGKRGVTNGEVVVLDGNTPVDEEHDGSNNDDEPETKKAKQDDGLEIIDMLEQEAAHAVESLPV